MKGDTVEEASVAYRKKRVKRIKRLIVGIVITLLVLPLVLSVFLLIKVHSLEVQIQKLAEEHVKEQTEESFDVVQAREKKEQVVPTKEPAPTEEPQAKKVYLTFDDGPGVQTGKILDILKKQDVKATFFVTGKEGAEAEKIYKRMVKEGHTLGMHSYSHIYDMIYESRDSFTKDLDRIYNYLYKVTGVYPRFYRFPGGSSTENTQLPMQTFMDVLEERQLPYLDWNVISPDINNSSVTKEQIVSGITQGVEAYDTSIVLMYDVADKPMTVKALPSIINQLKAQNYELLPVDETTTLIQHNNGNQEEEK